MGCAGHRLRRVPAAEALRILAPSTMFELRSTGEELGRLAALVRKVPSYALELSPEIGGLSDIMLDLVNGEHAA